MVFKIGCENDSLKKEGEEKGYPLPGSNTLYENVAIKKHKRAKKGICCLLSCLLMIIALLATTIFFGFRTYQYKKWNTYMMENCQMKMDDGGLYNSYNLGNGNGPRPPPTGNMPSSEMLWPNLASAIKECVIEQAAEEVSDEVDQDGDIIAEEDDVEVAYGVDAQCLKRKIIDAKNQLKIAIGLSGLRGLLYNGEDRD